MRGNGAICERIKYSDSKVKSKILLLVKRKLLFNLSNGWKKDEILKAF